MKNNFGKPVTLVIAVSGGNGASTVIIGKYTTSEILIFVEPVYMSCTVRNLM